MNKVVIMVVAWNNSDDVKECVQSLQGQTLAPTILIVDNNSKPEESEILRSIPDVEYINTGYNGGTAGGFNAGVKWAMEHDYEHVGTLNADAIADSHWVESLVAELNRHNKIGLATGILARRDGKTIDTTGDFYTIWGVPGPRLRDAPIEKAPTESGEVFGSSGGGFVAHTDLFRDIGMFDEKFFMYFEDVDLCFRAQLAGWRTRYTPHALAYHKLGASSGTVPGLATYNTFKNLPVLFIKNVPIQLMPKIWPRFTLAYFLFMASAVRKGRGWPAVKGWLVKFTLIPHALRERRRIQKSREVTIAYLNDLILQDIPPEQTGLRKFRSLFTGKK